jgi:hypothetical protein
MTVTTSSNKIVHVSDGVQTVFSYDFLVFDAAHMKVYEDGIITTKTYSVTGVGNSLGGTVVFSPTPPSSTNNQLTLLRVVPFSQEVDYQPFDAFPAETHERALDLGAMADQQLGEEQSRNVQSPIGSEPGVSYELPPYSAGKAWMWSEQDPKQIVNSDDNLNGIIGAANAAASAAEVSATNSANSAGSAASSEGAAAGSAAAASTSENNASASELKAAQWAQKAEDAPVEPGLFSAFHWAQKAEGTVVGGPGDSFTPTTGASLVLNSGDAAYVHTLDQAMTISNSALDANKKYNFLIECIQDGTGGHVITFPANTTWPYGETPAIPVGANDVFEFVLTTRDQGASWKASWIGAAYA